MPKIMRSLVAVGFAVACAAFAATMPASAATPAESFVQSNVDKGLAILNDQSLSKAQRQDQFRGFLTTLTDLKRIALYTLGPARRTASPADQAAFVDAFKEYAFAVYGAEFAKYSGQTLKVIGTVQRAPGDELVRTQLVDPTERKGEEPIEVDFRVYGNGGHFSVVDIIVAGLDLAITEQDDFGSFLAQHNQNVRALIDNLRTRAERIRSTGEVSGG